MYFPFVDDDLDTEWETIRGLPGTKSLTEDVDLRREWQGMAPHPEFVYRFIDEQYGLRYMSIWRLKCHGQKFLKRGAVYRAPMYLSSSVRLSP